MAPVWRPCSFHPNLQDVRLEETMFLVFTRVLGVTYRKWFNLCGCVSSYAFDIHRALLIPFLRIQFDFSRRWLNGMHAKLSAAHFMFQPIRTFYFILFYTSYFILLRKRNFHGKFSFPMENIPMGQTKLWNFFFKFLNFFCPIGMSSMGNSVAVPRKKASCNRVVLPNLQYILFFVFVFVF